MKSLVGKIGTLALVAMAGIAVNGCSSSLEKHSPTGSTAEGSEHSGTVGLKLQPVSGITVSQVHYVVTAGNPASMPAPLVVADGDVPTPGLSDNFAFGIPLPVGSGYYISISGVSAELNDDITCTGGFGPFAVTANTSTPFAMTLLCVDNTKGQILSTVSVTTDACPRLIVDYAVAEPGTQITGKSISLHSKAHDLDNNAETIKYAWSFVKASDAAVGQFAAATADTDLLCNKAGDSVKIKITATNHQCSKSLETVISCTDEKCGNGTVDPGETCDKKNDPTCPSDCTRECGDGQVETGETCDPVPAAPALCIPKNEAGACTLRPLNNCGDGWVNGTEACDTNGNKGPNQLPLPSGSTCKADCSGVSGPRCGDGMTAGSETCDAGTGTNDAPIPKASQTCSGECEQVISDACLAAEQAGDCASSSNNCFGPANAFSTAQTTLCFDVIQCVQTSGCLKGADGSMGKCYCGTLTTGECNAAPFDLTKPGAPNGACAPLIQQGSPGVTSNTQMLGAFTTRSRPAGAAGQRLNCEKNDANAATPCGVN